MLGLTEHRCPECGAAFDPEYASIAAHLLPWERPETGSALRRVFRTLIRASFHPAQYFENVCNRKDRRIDRAGKLVAAFVTLSLGFLAAEYLAGKVVYFLQVVAKYHRPAKALDSVWRLASNDWSLQTAFWLFYVAWPTLTVVVLAGFIRWLFGRKIGALRWIDLVAVYSPVVAMVAFIAAGSQLALAVSSYTLDIEDVLEAADWAQLAVILLLHWFACRRLLQLNRWVGVAMGVAMLVVGWGVQEGCGRAVVYLHWLYWSWGAG